MSRQDGPTARAGGAYVHEDNRGTLHSAMSTLVEGSILTVNVALKESRRSLDNKDEHNACRTTMTGPGLVELPSCSLEMRYEPSSMSGATSWTSRCTLLEGLDRVSWDEGFDLSLSFAIEKLPRCIKTPDKNLMTEMKAALHHSLNHSP